MTKKILLLSVTLVFLCSSCTKYFDGITNFDNYNLNWNPNFGLAVLNANISYNDLKSAIPTDSNFTVSAQSIGNGDSILVIHANESILSVLNDFFVLQNFSYDVPERLPIISATKTFQIPINQLIKVEGVTGFIQSIKFTGGVINLKLTGNGVQNINSIKITLGGVSSNNITPTNNSEVIVPINLNNRSITVSNDNIALAITINSKSNTPNQLANISLNSENLDFTAITLNNFSYTANKPIETSISMNFFDKINSGGGFTLQFNQPVKLTLNYNNQADLNVTIPSIAVDYVYKNNPLPKDTIITGITNGKIQSFEIPGVSNLLTKVNFKLTPSISSNTPQITLSKTSNVELKGSVEIPLDLNIQGVKYETNINLPKISDNAILDALENLTIKTQSNNEFPVELKCILRILNEAGQKIDSIDLGNLIKGENVNTTNSFDKEIIQKLVSTGKGQVVLGIDTRTNNGQTNGKFTTKAKLSLRIGMSIKANGKDILKSL